jgi:phosphate transport system ATP-binding protein
LRQINAENSRLEGQIIIHDDNRLGNILAPDTDLIVLRKKVGMVFQRPNVFNLSIYQNLRFGLCIHQMLNKKNEILAAIQNGLEHVGLWDELKDNLGKNARSLTLEQQQRLCIARVLILKPEIILLDEPCSALDPIATLKIEELLRMLRKEYALVIVTHNMQQAARVSDYTGLLYLGQLVEFGDTTQVFINPKEKLTENYITGRFG